MPGRRLMEAGLILAQSLTILGSGYTAKYVFPLAGQHYAQVLATSREPDRHLSHLQPDRRLRFDLAKPETWSHIPRNSDLLWCFPAVPLELVQQFSEAASFSLRRVVVLASTSAYDVGSSAEYPPPWCDETSAINREKPRVQGEEYLRSQYGAIILRVAGIYGPNRDPINWIMTGRVQPSRKYVNLIHVEDLARVSVAALRHATSGEVYNVSDGTPRTWNDICEAAGILPDDRPPLVDDSALAGKRISNNRMLGLLASARTGLQYPDVVEALLGLRRQARSLSEEAS